MKHAYLCKKVIRHKSYVSYKTICERVMELKKEYKVHLRFITDSFGWWSATIDHPICPGGISIYTYYLPLQYRSYELELMVKL